MIKCCSNTSDHDDDQTNKIVQFNAKEQKKKIKLTPKETEQTIANHFRDYFPSDRNQTQWKERERDIGTYDSCIEREKKKAENLIKLISQSSGIEKWKGTSYATSG